MNYYILDDDLTTRKMLQRIIREELLGDVLGDSGDPVHAKADILTLQPDIVLIDLLMPLQDGLETVKQLQANHFTGKFIMISQIENKEMVAQAYSIGIEYFIHKPVNRIEVTSVIHKVLDHMKMTQSLQKIKEGLSLLPTQNEQRSNSKINLDSTIQSILADLGILGETGTTDLIELLKLLLTKTENMKNIPLKLLYVEMLEQQNSEINEKVIKALEQRLRRCINQALTNLASLGLTDYAHPKFEHYASKFFDFNEVRLKMNELDEKIIPRNPRINIRKFLYAFYVEIKSRL